MKIHVVSYYEELPISYKEAGMRVLIDSIFNLLLGLATVYAILSISPVAYYSLSTLEKEALFQPTDIGWYDSTMIAIVIWSVLNGLSLLITEKSRALHDVVGGTVVVLRE